MSPPDSPCPLRLQKSIILQFPCMSCFTPGILPAASDGCLHHRTRICSQFRERCGQTACSPVPGQSGVRMSGHLHPLLPDIFAGLWPRTYSFCCSFSANLRFLRPPAPVFSLSRPGEPVRARNSRAGPGPAPSALEHPLKTAVFTGMVLYDIAISSSAGFDPAPPPDPLAPNSPRFKLAN